MKSLPARPAEWLLISAAALAAVVGLAPDPLSYALGAGIGILALAWLASGAVRWIGLFLGANLLLPPLPAPFGGSGAHPAVLAAAAGLCAAFVFSGRWRFAERTVTGPAVALMLAIAVSVSMAMFAGPREIAIGSAVRALLFALTPFLFLYVVSGPGQSLASAGLRPAMWLYAAGVLSALLACFDFFYQLPAPAGYSPQFVWLSDRVLRRAQGLFYDAGQLGNLCAFFLVMAAAAMLEPARKGLGRAWIAAGAAPLAVAMVLSYSRASVVSLLVSLVALLMVRRKASEWLRTALVAAVVGVVAISVVSALAPGLAGRWLQHLWSTIDLAFSATDSALSGRLSSWGLLTGFVVEHPLRTLAGVGYKTLAYSDVLGAPVIPDNTYLSVLIETGIAGLSALCMLHAAILRVTYRAASSGSPVAAFYGRWIFAFWAGEIVQMGAADLLTYWRLLPVFFFVIALAALMAREAG